VHSGAEWRRMAVIGSPMTELEQVTLADVVVELRRIADAVEPDTTSRSNISRDRRESPCGTLRTRRVRRRAMRCGG
jgi:hypothetical protein